MSPECVPSDTFNLSLNLLFYKFRGRTEINFSVPSSTTPWFSYDKRWSIDKYATDKNDVYLKFDSIPTLHSRCWRYFLFSLWLSHPLYFVARSSFHNELTENNTSAWRYLYILSYLVHEALTSEITYRPLEQETRIFARLNYVLSKPIQISCWTRCYI